MNIKILLRAMLVAAFDMVVVSFAGAVALMVAYFLFHFYWPLLVVGVLIIYVLVIQDRYQTIWEDKFVNQNKL